VALLGRLALAVVLPVRGKGRKLELGSPAALSHSAGVLSPIGPASPPSRRSRYERCAAGSSLHRWP
jgi:hypothetical protein